MQAALPPSRDWTLRPFEATRRAPLLVGAALIAAFLGLGLAYWNLFGIADGLYLDGVPLYRSLPGCLEVLNATIFAFLPTATFYARRGAARDLHALRPVLRVGDAEFEALLARAVSARPARLLALGLGGGALFAGMVFLDPGFWIGGRPETTSPLFLWVLARHVATGWLGGHALGTGAHLALAFARIGRTKTEVDLLDLSALRPFARLGQRSALAWILLSMLVSCYWLTPSAGTANPYILAFILTVVALAFVAPATGVHRAIRARKEEELARLRDEIRVERERALASREAGGGRLADLIAYRDLVERAREWPWDVPTLLRLALYVGLGAGSWLGGALVERLLERFLG